MTGITTLGACGLTLFTLIAGSTQAGLTVVQDKAASSNKPAAFFPLLPGARWKWRFQAKPGGTPITMEWRAVREVDAGGGKKAWELRATRGSHRSWEYWSAPDDGIYKFDNRYRGGMRGVAKRPGPTRLVPGPIGATTIWKWNEMGSVQTGVGSTRPSDDQLRMNYVGRIASMSEAVEVPAGKYQAVRIVITMTSGYFGKTEESLWLVRDTGIVKRVVRNLRDGREHVRELLSFARGKPVAGPATERIRKLLAASEFAKFGAPDSIAPIVNADLEARIESSFHAIRWDRTVPVCALVRNHAGKTTVFHPLSQECWNDLLRDECEQMTRRDGTGITKAFGVLLAEYAGDMFDARARGSEISVRTNDDFDVKAHVHGKNTAGEKTKGWAKMTFKGGKLVSLRSNLVPQTGMIVDDLNRDEPVQRLSSDTNNQQEKARRAGGDENKRYLMYGPKPGAKPPKTGYALLLILPGGGGGENFKGFCQRIHRDRTDMTYLAAQLISKQWRENQKIVWPTKRNKVAGMKFSTEQFIAAVVRDVRKKHKLDPKRIFTLSWSSSGPAAYATSLTKGSPITGSLIAMSVFKPNFLPGLKRAKGHTYYLLHSPDDRTCPYRMAGDARERLRAAGARVKLATYRGGHGWQGSAYAKIRDGIQWLERPVEASYTRFATDGFEKGKSAPTGWNRGAAVEGVEYLWARPGAKSKKSLGLKKTANRYLPIAGWSRRFEHTSHSNVLRVSLSAKADKARKSVVEIQFHDKDGAFLNKTWAFYIGARKAGDPPVTHDWKRLQEDVDIPTGTARITVALQIYGPGTTWFDDLELSYQDQLRK